MGENEMGENEGAISGVLGESIPLEAMDPSKDPNIMVDEVGISDHSRYAQENLDSESEDDLDIRPTDCVLLAAKSDEDQRYFLSLSFLCYPLVFWRCTFTMRSQATFICTTTFS